MTDISKPNAVELLVRPFKLDAEDSEDDHFADEAAGGGPKSATGKVSKQDRILSILSKSVHSLEGAPTTPGVTVNVPQGLREPIKSKAKPNLSVSFNDGMDGLEPEDEGAGTIIKPSRGTNSPRYPFKSQGSDKQGIDDEEISFTEVDITEAESVSYRDGNNWRSNKTLVVVPKTETQADVATEEEEEAAQPRWRAFLVTADDWLKRKLQYVYVFIMLYAAPVCAAIYSPLYIITILYYSSIGCVIFVNIWMVCEAFCAFCYTAKQRKLHHSRPEIIGERRLGAIVAAYLPNELTVLIDTVRAVSRTIHELPEGTTLDIVLAHNGGKKEQRIALLEDLRKIEGDIPPNVKVHELNVLSSRSKAENVNAALAFFQELGSVRGNEFTQLAMYDADHQPIPEAWRYALETMQDQEADMVMGRCAVRDGLKTIAVEFDVMYAVAHAGGRCVRGFGFFGGSNGYWDYQTLVETGMDEDMLTEDIDASFRAQAAGHRMTYDPTIVSFEESPPDFLALFKQRLRWSQGWSEVAFRQITLPFRRAPGLTLWSRFCIFLLLHYRELYVYLSAFTVPIAVVFLLRLACGWSCVDYWLLGLLAFCVCVPIANTFAAWWLTKDRHSGVHYRMPGLKPWDYFRYMLVSFPYELFKVHVTLIGHAREAMCLNKWVVTRRKTTKDPTAPIYTSSIHRLNDPEILITQSPHAPAERQLFAGTYDVKRTEVWGGDPIAHGAITVSKEVAGPRDPVLEKAHHFRLVSLQELAHFIHAVQFANNDFIETIGTGAVSPSDDEGDDVVYGV